jgi:ATP-dependent DNA helicase RecQ
MKNPQSILRDTFGFDDFRVGQREIVDAVIAGKNTLAIMPTGGGNRCAFSFLLWFATG